MNVDSPLYAVLLGIIQGISEFLPISSSGHLIILSWAMGGKSLPLVVNISLHLGTLAAIVVFFWKDWWLLAQKALARLKGNGASFESDTLLPALILGSVPAAIVGLGWEKLIEELFHNPISVTIPLFLVGIALWLGELKSKKEKSLKDLTIKMGIIIGVAQAFALIPGTSRSGITMLAGLMLGFKKEDAAKFSFLLGTPAMGGAALLHVKDLIEMGTDLNFYIGVFTSFVVGMLSIKFLLKFLAKNGFFAFAVYRAIIAIIILVAAW